MAKGQKTRGERDEKEELLGSQVVVVVKKREEKSPLKTKEKSFLRATIVSTTLRYSLPSLQASHLHVYIYIYKPIYIYIYILLQ